MAKQLTLVDMYRICEKVLNFSYSHDIQVRFATLLVDNSDEFDYCRETLEEIAENKGDKYNGEVVYYARKFCRLLNNIPYQRSAIKKTENTENNSGARLKEQKILLCDFGKRTILFFCPRDRHVYKNTLGILKKVMRYGQAIKANRIGTSKYFECHTLYNNEFCGNIHELDLLKSPHDPQYIFRKALLEKSPERENQEIVSLAAKIKANNEAKKALRELELREKKEQKRKRQLDKVNELEGLLSGIVVNNETEPNEDLTSLDDLLSGI